MKKLLIFLVAILLTKAEVSAHTHGHDHGLHIHDPLSFERHIDAWRGVSFMVVEGAELVVDEPHLQRIVWEDEHTGARLVYTIAPNPRVLPQDLLFAAEVMAMLSRSTGWRISASHGTVSHALAIGINQEETLSTYRFYIIQGELMVSLSATGFHPDEFDRFFQAAEHLDFSLSL